MVKCQHCGFDSMEESLYMVGAPCGYRGCNYFTCCRSTWKEHMRRHHPEAWNDEDPPSFPLTPYECGLCIDRKNPFRCDTPSELWSHYRTTHFTTEKLLIQTYREFILKIQTCREFILKNMTDAIKGNDPLS